jgi:hypothetical protein
MAKRAPQRKRRSLEKDPVSGNYHLQFLFPGLPCERFPQHYLSELAGKIRTEHASHAEICCLTSEAAPIPEEHPLVRFIPGDPGQGHDREFLRDGYAVILEPRPLERLFNPNEFFRLPLAEAGSRKTCYEIRFRGKKAVDRGGLIIPSDVMRYMLATNPVKASLDPGVARLILEKLGFEREEVTIHQEPPFSDERKPSFRIREKIRLSLAWNTTLPVREARDRSLRQLFFTREHPLFRLAFFVTALAIFVLIPVLSLDAGLSGDDEKHYEHAIKVFRYFSEGDPSALDDPRYKLNYYGQSFDYFSYLLIRLFSLEENPYEARHVMTGITGATAILFTGLLVRLFAGYSGGLLALVLMFLSPRFLGHAFNNPMDVPFALGNIFTLYHMILFMKRLPGIRIWSVIWIAVGIGWTNGIRIGGLLLVPYLFMFVGLFLLLHRWPWKFFSAGWWKLALKVTGILVLTSAAGYLLSLLTWPYALQDIVNHPIQAFKVMSNIQVSIRVLYDGMLYWSDHLPWHYIPKNVMFTVPVIILLGWFASLVTWYVDRKEGNGYWYFLLWFTVLFPVFFIIYRESNVYGGWRHMMFIYPSMLALSAMALSSMIRRARKRWLRLVLVAVIAAGLFPPLRHVIRNHPNTYIYFNALPGGIRGAFGTFETDYYANSLRPASDYFIEKILPGLKTTPGEPVRVVSNFSVDYYFRKTRDRVRPFYGRYYDRGKYDWDYAILYCNYIHPFQLKNGLWPPKNTIHEIRVDDVVVAAIVERKNWDDYLGSSLLAEGMMEENGNKVDRAVWYLENAVEYDPYNEAAYLELGNAYTASLRFDEARSAMDRLLEFYPDYDKAYNTKGYSYLIEAEVRENEALIDEAIRFINLAIRSNYKYYTGYYNLGLCYGMKKDRDNAEYNFQRAIWYNGRFREAYERLAELYDFYGETENANLVREQASRLP